MPRPKDTTATVTYGDHEIITPENKLRGAVSKTPDQSGDDPIARAEKALGDKFSLRDFHDEVLRDGAMPLAVLEEKIERWIAQRKRT
jgi:hypothetical protein